MYATDEQIAALTEPQRECLRAYFFIANYKAVARELNISVDAVKDRLERARRTMGAANSHSAAYMLAVAEGRVTPPEWGSPPSGGLATFDDFGSDNPLPAIEAPAAGEIRDVQSFAFFERPEHLASRMRPSRDQAPQSHNLAGSVLRAAQAIALILVAAWVAMAAINSLQPSFFRFLDNLHS